MAKLIWTVEQLKLLMAIPEDMEIVSASIVKGNLVVTVKDEKNPNDKRHLLGQLNRLGKYEDTVYIRIKN